MDTWPKVPKFEDVILYLYLPIHTRKYSLEVRGVQIEASR